MTGWRQSAALRGSFAQLHEASRGNVLIVAADRAALGTGHDRAVVPVRRRAHAEMRALRGPYTYALACMPLAMGAVVNSAVSFVSMMRRTPIRHARSRW